VTGARLSGWLCATVIAIGVLAAGPSRAMERELRLTAVADGYAKASRASRSFGTRSRLVVTSKPETTAFLRFVVPPLDGQRIAAATLRLRVVAARRSRNATGGTVYLAGTAAWSEGDLTFKRQPKLAPAPIASIGRVSRREIIEIPVTGAVLPGTEVTFALVGEDSDRARYVSREADSDVPVLILQVVDAPEDLPDEARPCEGCAGEGAAGDDGGTCQSGCESMPSCVLDYYGSYSLRTKYASSPEERVEQLRDLGGNFVAAIGESLDRLDALPPGMMAVPGCGLMHEEDWQTATGVWSADVARLTLAALAEKYDGHPKVWGVCISHEVTEYADHDLRLWMYRLAKEFFHQTKVMHYYSRVPEDYGRDGAVESDVLFISLPPYTETGEYDLERVVRRLDAALLGLERTPGVPVWALTSINADQGYVTGPETMVRTWGASGENMLRHTQELFTRTGPSGQRLSGFFWRSLGRFAWDLGYPPFVAHRNRMAEIADRWLCE
jgi:hypothetical protein